MGTTLRRERDTSNAPVNNTVDVQHGNVSCMRACAHASSAFAQRSEGAHGDILHLLTVQLRAALRGWGRVARVCRPSRDADPTRAWRWKAAFK